MSEMVPMRTCKSIMVSHKLFLFTNSFVSDNDRVNFRMSIVDFLESFRKKGFTYKNCVGPNCERNSSGEDEFRLLIEDFPFEWDYEYNLIWKFCKFPRFLGERLLGFQSGAKNIYNNTLGKLILQVLGQFPLPKLGSDSRTPPVWFTVDMQRVLDSNVDYMAKGIEKCIAMHGYDNVLIAEPWTRRPAVPYTNIDSVFNVSYYR